MSMKCAETPAFWDRPKQQAKSDRRAALCKDPRLLVILPAPLCVAMWGCSLRP